MFNITDSSNLDAMRGWNAVFLNVQALPSECLFTVVRHEDTYGFRSIGYANALLKIGFNISSCLCQLLHGTYVLPLVSDGIFCPVLLFARYR